ncbi:MAG: alcohol dehydrogenase catalytic domain-containing protein [Gemmatimonadota bacterium]|jgi:L-iditol 2-dehydrogenase|nr:MAG: alcohol dehydrogenase catalytic domain-containing protein [Gemmatimonadota bacterium]
MRAAVYYNNRDIRLEERSRPAIGAGELLVRIEASGICGSDLMEWYRVPKAPIVLGHEVAGVVEEVGQGVEGFAVGDRVVTTHHVPCNTCRYCLTGRQSVCDTLKATHFDPGGFAEFVRLPALNVDRGTFRLPDQVSFEEATFVEPLACAVRAFRIAAFEPGQSVAVLGSGISGVLFIQLARALGAGPILATDMSADRLATARRFGATAVLPAESDVAQGIRDANGGQLVERVFVCTAALPAIRQALGCVDRGGTVMLYAPADPGMELELPLLEVWANGTNIVHSYAGPPADMQTALDLIAAGRVDVAGMVTHRLPLAETQKGFDLVLAGRGSLKVIVEPQR